MAQLSQLGVRTVPVIARGKQWVNGLVLNDIVEFLELDGKLEPVLTPAELVQRLDLIIQAAQRYARQFSAEQLQLKLPNRERSYRVLTHHVFRIPEAFLDAVNNRIELTYEATVAPPPAELQNGAAIAVYGEQVRQALLHWWQDQGMEGSAGEETVDTYYGQQTVHELLERTTWHSGQHVRQMMSLLTQLGIEPHEPLADAVCADLPMPTQVWDD